MTGWNNHYKDVCVYILLRHFITSEVLSVISDKAWIILPEDGMVDLGEHAYQIILLQSCPGLFFLLNLGPGLAADLCADYDHGETSLDLNSAE